MDKIVYLLCIATSVLCAVMLLRGFRRSGTRLLLWSAICFVLFAVSNVLIYVDLIMFPDVEIFIFRNVLTLSGLTILLYGLIWETV